MTIASLEPRRLRAATRRACRPWRSPRRGCCASGSRDTRCASGRRCWRSPCSRRSRSLAAQRSGRLAVHLPVDLRRRRSRGGDSVVAAGLDAATIVLSILAAGIVARLLWLGLGLLPAPLDRRRARRPTTRSRDLTERPDANARRHRRTCGSPTISKGPRRSACGVRSCCCRARCSACPPPCSAPSSATSSCT